MLLCAYTNENRQNEMNYAHIFGSKAKGWRLYICGPSIVGEKAVSYHASKAAAKAAAKALGATPYNY